MNMDFSGKDLRDINCVQLLQENHEQGRRSSAVFIGLFLCEYTLCNPGTLDGPHQASPPAANPHRSNHMPARLSLIALLTRLRACCKSRIAACLNPSAALAASRIASR